MNGKAQRRPRTSFRAAHEGDPLPLRPCSDDDGHDGIKLPSQGNRLHKQGYFMPFSTYPPRKPFKRRQKIAQRGQLYAQIAGVVRVPGDCREGETIGTTVDTDRLPNLCDQAKTP
jgi:hypothetical protein